MESYSKTDEVLALLNKHERGEASSIVAVPMEEESLGFTDFLPSPAVAVFHKLQRVSAQPRSEQPVPSPLTRTASEALKVVLGEQRPVETRKLRRSTASFRRKLFGHEQQEGYEDNIITRDMSANYVRIHPLSAFKRYWDLAIVIMVAYTVVVLPVRCAFSWDYYHALDAGHNLFHQLAVDWTLATDLLIDLFFMSDIFLNFNTGFISDQRLVMGHKAVARKYLQGWFTLDLVSSFPIDLVLFGKRSDLWRLPRLLKVIRVLHNKTLAKAAHDIKRLKLLSDISQFDSQILKLTTYVFLWIHWNACLQYGSCVAQPDSSMCWVAYNHLQSAGVFEKYSWSALKALSEMVTAGYGKQDPETMVDVWVTMISLLMGTTMWLILGSIITTLLIHLNAAHSEYTAKMTALSQYMMENNLPQELRQRIRDSYEARWKAEKHFDEDQILNEMPGSLRIEVCMHTCAELIASVPFLEDAEDGFVRYLVTQLHPTVYLRNDMIIRTGELGREMFFIKAGAVQVELDGKPITLLKKGSYFGELALLRDMRRTASVRVVSETCDLFVLTKDDFLEVTKDYPEAWHSMNLVAEHRIRMLHTSPAFKQWEDNQKRRPSPSSKLSIKIEQVLEARDISGESSSDEDSKLQVPSPALTTAKTVQSKGKLQWTDTLPTTRRPPSAGPGLSLKQQASSPRWGARRGIGPALVSPGAQSRMTSSPAVPLQRRPVQGRSSALGLPIRSRRAVSEDDSETEPVDTGLCRAQSVNAPRRQPRELDKPFIELSDLSSDHITGAGQAFLGSPTPQLSSAESLSTRQSVQMQLQLAGQQRLPEKQNDYGGWAATDAGAQVDRDEDDSPNQRLLP